MVEPEALDEPYLDVPHDAVGVRALADASMQRHHAAALRDRPDMDVMHLLHAFHMGDEVGADRARIELSGRAFEQDMA